LQATAIIGLSLRFADCLAADLPVEERALVLPFLPVERSVVDRLEPSCFRNSVGDFKIVGRSVGFITTDGYRPVCELNDQEIKKYRRPNGTLLQPLPEADGYIATKVLRRLTRFIYLIEVEINLGGTNSVVRFVGLSMVKYRLNAAQMWSDVAFVRFVLSPKISTEREAVSKAMALVRHQHD
jgi:hypothetical protein